MRPIAEDSLEHSRIRLERDIESTIPPPPSMSFDLGVRDEDDDDVSSVDFPRHNQHHPSFHSFEHASHLDSDFYSRHDDDSMALDADPGYTMSTAAHHASALTLSAGLRGRDAYSHPSGKVSLSGGEYDPDRPLQAILDNRIAEGMSIFDATSHSKSRNATRSAPSFEPVVVDSTLELDRYLRTGYDRPTRLVYPYSSRSNSQPTSNTSESEAAHPRLAHALGRDFSPKRPRRTLVSIKEPSDFIAKPRIVSSKINTGAQAPKPEKSIPVNLAPSRSEVPNVAQKDSDAPSRISRKSAFPAASRAPFSEIGNKHARVVLPDVTGITSAVESPAKTDALYANAQETVPSSRTLNLLPALDALRTRLQALERANSVSRRRVRELEHELEECRAEVLAERTRIEERVREAVHTAAGRHLAEAESQYRAVVKEKKALEALLASLRTHLARLTEELSAHKAVVERLRNRGGHDARAEIQKLRAEVERLAGEVERLKAIVEEGLRERRRAKEVEEKTQQGDDAENVQEMPAQVGIDLTYATAAPQDERQQDREGLLTMDDLQSIFQQRERGVSSELGPMDGGSRVHYSGPDSKPHEEKRHESVEDVEYHHVSEGATDEYPASEAKLAHSNAGCYIDASEIARVEAEMRERRSERSRSTASRDDDSGNGSSLREATATPAAPASSRLPTTQQDFRRDEDQKENERLSVPTHESGDVPPGTRVRPSAPSPRTPFPYIRGSRMERLFFSAPEHNVRTCAACRRRQRGGALHPRPSREFDKGSSEVDGDEEDVREGVRAYLRRRATAGPPGKREGGEGGDGDRPPPQTVLVRVLRELEDDFSHYKAIYLELAEQYGAMDAVSNVAKRNVLADHLRDVIDTLEQRGDQIASLYELISYQDKPLPQTRAHAAAHRDGRPIFA